MVSLDSLCKPFLFHFSYFFCCYVAIAPLGLVVKACFQARSSLKRKHFCLQHVLFILFHVEADLVHDLQSTALRLRIIQKLFPKSLAFKLYQSRTNKQYLNSQKSNITSPKSGSRIPTTKNKNKERVFECACKGSVTHSRQNFFFIIFSPHDQVLALEAFAPGEKQYSQRLLELTGVKSTRLTQICMKLSLIHVVKPQ